MKKIIHTIFPYRLYLHIFQLEGYSVMRTFRWIQKNPFVRTTQNKKPLQYTGRVKAIVVLSVLIACGAFVSIARISLSTGFWLLTLFIIEPSILIFLSDLCIKPYAWLKKTRALFTTSSKIDSLTHVQVVGIAGSYGKTSVKDILYHLLKEQYRVLKTPQSYNTIFGIAQVVDLELDNTYDFFLCELGEFKRGDIAEMCRMVHPTFGIITGINDQHLERFKTIENTVRGIFELADFLQEKSRATVVNNANTYIAEEVQKRSNEDFVLYGDTSGELQVGDIHFSKNGTTFSLRQGEKIFSLETPLLGYAQVQNIVGAMTLALQLGAPIEMLVERVATLPHVPHRFDQSVLSSGLVLIDNAYSSNSDSFKESVRLLSEFGKKYTILVTPGMVELGETNDTVHSKLGALAGEVCTKVILVGKTARTKALASTIPEEKIVWMDHIMDLWKTVQTFGYDPNETVVLIENDLPDNYQ